MPKFFYVTRDTSGNKVTGVEEAFFKDELVLRLQARGLIVVGVSGEKESKNASLTDRLRLRRYRITNQDLVLLCRQLATLLSAGVNILKSLDILSQQVASRKLYNVLIEMQRSMEQGLSLRDAIAKHPKVFSELWVNLVESGEAGGNLAIVLTRLASYLERNEAFKRQIISALIYPAILLLASVSALLFMTMKIIPIFAELFLGFNIELPQLTKILIAVSSFLRKYIFIIAGLEILGYYMFKKYTGTRKGRMRYEELKFKLPLFGEFYKALVVERFSSNMTTLLESGVPILYSLEITERNVSNLVLADIIHKVKEEVRAGKSFSQPLDNSKFFEPMVVQMVRIGEEIGELPDMFKKINAFYQESIQTFLNRFSVLFEPLMLVFLGVVIGVMVIGLFLPIFKLTEIGSVGSK